MPISGAKNEPSGHGKVLLREQQKDQQMWKHSAVHCQILKRANVQLFQRHLYTHRLCELQLAASQKCLHFAETCTLIFVFGGGNGGRPGLSRALEPALACVGRLLLLPVTKKGLFFGPKKTRKTRDANTGLPSSRFPPRKLRFCAHGSLQSFSISDK